MLGRLVARLAILTVLGPACLPAQALPSPGFGFAAPGFQGSFANALGDRLEMTVAGDGVAGHFTAADLDLTLNGCIESTRVRGTAQGDGGSAEPMSALFEGDVMHLTVGQRSWRLRTSLPLDATLAELGEPEVDATRQWTIAVYLSGDNDLENAAIGDLLEMQKGMPKQGVEVIVLLDRWKGPPDEKDDSWTDARVLRVQPGDDGTFTTLGEPRERDMGDPTTLASFTAGVFRKYPAPHHAVILWDHGGGWTGMGVDLDAPGRPDGRSQLSLQGIRDGLRSGLLGSRLLRLDLVAFDACLMGQLEVALGVHDLAEVMIASEAVVPGSGFPYTDVLPHFAAATDPRVIGKAIVGDYAAFSEDVFKSGSTLCAFDLDRIPDVAARLEIVARQALACAPMQWAAIARALFFAECYEVRSERVADNACGSIDLLDLSSRLRGIAGIANAAIDDLQQSIGASVLARHAGAERTLSKGLSIYGPHRRKQYDPNYAQTPLGVGGTWPALLQLVHERGAADVSPVTLSDFRLVTATGDSTDTVHPFGGERLLFSAAGKSIIEVQQHTMQYDTAGKVWLLLRRELVTDPLWPRRWATAAAADAIDLVMPEYQDGKNDLFAEQGGLTFAISNGARQAYASLDLSTPSMQAPIIVYTRYQAKAGGEPVVVQITFDRAWWRAVAVRPVQNPTPGTAARTLEPGPEDTFSFALETRTDAGEPGVVWTEPLAWGTEGLHLSPEADEAGRYRVEMVARTIQGSTHSAHTDFTIADNPDLAAWPASWQGFDPATLLGTWDQFLVVGPQQYRDLKCTAEVSADPLVDNVVRVLQKGGPAGAEFETHQRWAFEWRGLPCLRVITEVADGQTFCWYGPTRIGVKDGKPFLVMKMQNGVGAVWEWRKR